MVHFPYDEQTRLDTPESVDDPAVCDQALRNQVLGLALVLEILDAGLDIVSTSEELSFPWSDNGDEAARIDAAAKRAGRKEILHP